MEDGETSPGSCSRVSQERSLTLSQSPLRNIQKRRCSRASGFPSHCCAVMNVESVSVALLLCCRNERLCLFCRNEYSLSLFLSARRLTDSHSLTQLVPFQCTVTDPTVRSQIVRGPLSVCLSLGNGFIYY
jgi:hypothetical protein